MSGWDGRGRLVSNFNLDKQCREQSDRHCAPSKTLTDRRSTTPVPQQRRSSEGVSHDTQRPAIRESGEWVRTPTSDLQPSINYSSANR